MCRAKQTRLRRSLSAGMMNLFKASLQKCPETPGALLVQIRDMLNTCHFSADYMQIDLSDLELTCSCCVSDLP